MGSQSGRSQGTKVNGTQIGLSTLSLLDRILKYTTIHFQLLRPCMLTSKEHSLGPKTAHFRHKVFRTEPNFRLAKQNNVRKRPRKI